MARLAKLTQPKVLLALALATAGVLLISWQSHLTFLADDWDLLIQRRGFTLDDFMKQHAGHVIIAPAAIYKAIESTLGMESLTPFAVVATGAFLATVVLLFVYLRTRVGEWTALLAVIPVLFMGSAYEDLLTPFQIGYFGALLFGLAAILALQRRDPLGDALACGFLIAALTFEEVAIPFLVGAAVAIAIDRGPLSRAYVVLAPLLFYAAWWVGWNSGDSTFSIENVARSPSYMLDGLAASVGSLFGFGPAFGEPIESALGWGRPLLIGLAVATVLWLRRRGTVSVWLPVPIAMALTFWFIAAANTALGRPPTASRYQLVGAIFLVMVGAECAAGLRLRWRGLIALAAVAAAATMSNLVTLHRSYRLFAGEAQVTRGALSGLEISAPVVDPGFLLTPENSDAVWFDQVDAARYLSAVDAFGSPAIPHDQLTAAPDGARISADKVLAAALRLHLRGVSGAQPHGDCTTRDAKRQPPSGVGIPPGGALLRAAPGSSAEISLRRFATAFPVNLGTFKGSAVLAIPRDLSDQQWYVHFNSTGPLTICALP